MDYQGWGFYLGEIHGHVYLAELFLKPNRVLGGARDLLKIIQPSHLLHCAVGNECGGEVLSNSWVITAPAMFYQGHQGLALFDRLGRSPLTPPPCISTIHDELGHSLWMAYREFDRDSSTLRNSK